MHGFGPHLRDEDLTKPGLFIVKFVAFLDHWTANYSILHTNGVSKASISAEGRSP